MSDSFFNELRERFRDKAIPWLLDFDRDPDRALHDMLRGVASVGHLIGSDPGKLLLDWLRGFGSQSPYARLLNEALTRWIENHWGNPLLPGTGPDAGGDATMTSLAWLRAVDTIAASPLSDPREDISPREYPLFGAATRLRERMLADRRFLDNMTEARSHDPQGRAWIALANHQADRVLLEEWWRLLSLPPDEPWYRGQYGLIGLRRLPPENPAFKDGFNKELAEGLGRFGEGLWRRSREGWLSEEAARAEFSTIARLTMARGDFPDRWRGYWRCFVGRHQEGDLLNWWPISEFGSSKPGRGKSSWIEYDPTWPERAQTLARMLRQPKKETIVQSEKLLVEQRHYADATGNTSFLVRTAGRFSGSIRIADPNQALTWARMAKGADPWNAHAWTNEAAALLSLGKREQALCVYGEAILRFPDNAVAHAGYAEVLKFLDRLDEALAAYGETKERFPDNAVARNGYAEVLKSLGRLDEALAAYGETKERFPENVVARNGYAEVLKSLGRLEEALAAYGETKERFPENIVVRTGYEGVLRAMQQRARATGIKEEMPIYEPKARMDEPIQLKTTGWGITTGIQAKEEATLVRSPESSYLASFERSALSSEEITRLITDAYLIRRWAREGEEDDPWLNTGAQRERAGELLAQLSAKEGHDPLVAGESGMLSLATGDRQRALDLLRIAVERFPGSPRVRYALARAEREEAMATEDAAAMTPRQWKKLVRLDRHLFPLQWLGPLLFQVRFPDSDSALRGNVRELAGWLRPGFASRDGADPSFYTWWGKAVYPLLFGATDLSERPDMGRIRGHVRANYRTLVAKEEELVYRHARR
uniref:Tetratricopeptide repeat-containing protein n=1 Tax=Candidatus Kentrum sp. FW TaxID=2126338 RepID=A0A450TIX3_9GAMM|nr:MAG: Tetratricopeptide repeat-containing protein [Candidatus Kentron sp. FW]